MNRRVGADSMRLTLSTPEAIRNSKVAGLPWQPLPRCWVVAKCRNGQPPYASAKSGKKVEFYPSRGQHYKAASEERRRLQWIDSASSCFTAEEQQKRIIAIERDGKDGRGAGEPKTKPTVCGDGETMVHCKAQTNKEQTGLGNSIIVERKKIAHKEIVTNTAVLSTDGKTVGGHIKNKKKVKRKAANASMKPVAHPKKKKGNKNGATAKGASTAAKEVYNEAEADTHAPVLAISSLDNEAGKLEGAHLVKGAAEDEMAENQASGHQNASEEGEIEEAHNNAMTSNGAPCHAQIGAQNFSTPQASAPREAATEATSAEVNGDSVVGKKLDRKRCVVSTNDANDIFISTDARPGYNSTKSQQQTEESNLSATHAEALEVRHFEDGKATEETSNEVNNASNSVVDSNLQADIAADDYNDDCNASSESSCDGADLNAAFITTPKASQQESEGSDTDTAGEALNVTEIDVVRNIDHEVNHCKAAPMETDDHTIITAERMKRAEICQRREVGSSEGSDDDKDDSVVGSSAAGKIVVDVGGDYDLSAAQVARESADLDAFGTETSASHNEEDRKPEEADGIMKQTLEENDDSIHGADHQSDGNRDVGDYGIDSAKAMEDEDSDITGVESSDASQGEKRRMREKNDSNADGKALNVTGTDAERSTHYGISDCDVARLETDERVKGVAAGKERAEMPQQRKAGLTKGWNDDKYGSIAGYSAAIKIVDYEDYQSDGNHKVGDNSEKAKEDRNSDITGTESSEASQGEKCETGEGRDTDAGGKALSIAGTDVESSTDLEVSGCDAAPLVTEERMKWTAAGKERAVISHQRDMGLAEGYNDDKDDSRASSGAAGRIAIDVKTNNDESAPQVAGEIADRDTSDAETSVSQKEEDARAEEADSEIKHAWERKDGSAGDTHYQFDRNYSVVDSVKNSKKAWEYWDTDVTKVETYEPPEQKGNGEADNEADSAAGFCANSSEQADFSTDGDGNGEEHDSSLQSDSKKDPESKNKKPQKSKNGNACDDASFIEARAMISAQSKAADIDAAPSKARENAPLNAADREPCHLCHRANHERAEVMHEERRHKRHYTLNTTAKLYEPPAAARQQGDRGRLAYV